MHRHAAIHVSGKNASVPARRLADILVRMETGRARWLLVCIDGQLAGQGQVDVTGKLYATINIHAFPWACACPL